MIKTILFHARRLSIRAKLRHATQSINESEHAINWHQQNIDIAYRNRADLQSQLFWLERSRMKPTTMAVHHGG